MILIFGADTLGTIGLAELIPAYSVIIAHQGVFFSDGSSMLNVFI